MSEIRKTQAPVDHIELAKRLSNQTGRLVHPDVMVRPICPVSRDLRERQEARRKKRNTVIVSFATK